MNATLTKLKIPYLDGFSTRVQESETVSLETIGQIPEWLLGKLVRTNPAIFESKDSSVKHWFDGLAMLHAFDFQQGDLRYTSRLLRSKAYESFVSTGQFDCSGFATAPSATLASTFKNMFSMSVTDNGNVNVMKLDNRYFALTETPNMVEFDPESLYSCPDVKYQDHLRLTTSTAHPQILKDGTMVNIGTQIGQKCSYVVYTWNTFAEGRKVLATIPIEEPGYIHSFAVTRNYVVFVHCPFVARPVDFVFGGKPYIENFNWKPAQGATIYGVELSTGNLKFQLQTDPIFIFHHINAYENIDGSITMDVAAYKDPQIIDQLYLNSLRNGQKVSAAEPCRFVINPERKSIRKTVLYAGDVELPAINPDCSGQPYRFAWAASSSSPTNFLDGLIKLDFESGNCKRWGQIGYYPGEPVFVSRPNAKQEDDGVILSVVLDSIARRSFLLVLDAQTMREVSRAYLPHQIPFGFHGQFWRQ